MQPRSSGKFAAKGDQHRKVRSVRLTDWAYDELQFRADCNKQSLADFLEELARSDESVESNEIVNILTNALTLKANAGGAIKEEIRKAIALLGGE
jgi:hypothetical protein